MQIKEFYLDLKEWPQYGKKQKDIRVLESEAFKEPLKFSFQFDSKDKRDLEQIKSDCKDYYERLISTTKRLEDKILELEEKEKMITKSYQEIEDLIDKYNKLLENRKKKETQINERGLEENKRIDYLVGEIQDLRKEINLPQPQKVYSNTWDEFVCWTDVYYGYDYRLPTWEYCILEQYEYEPQNEYVANENKILIKEQHIYQKYIPEIQLYSTNAMDKPVAKVRLTVLFFQI